MMDFQPIETAPWQETIWVKNEQMEKPVKATRGYAHNGTVHPDQTFCTSVYTSDPYFPTPAGQLVCATEWAPLDE